MSFSFVWHWGTREGGRGDRALLEEQADQGPALPATRKPVPCSHDRAIEPPSDCSSSCIPGTLHQDRFMKHNVLVIKIHD